MNTKILHIHRDLDEFSKDIDNSQLLSFLESFESIVIEIAKKTILNIFSSDKEDIFFEINNTIYSINISGDIIDTHNLIIALIDTQNIHGAKDKTQGYFQKDNIGKYKSFTIVISDGILYKKSRIVEAIKELYVISYAWLDDFLRRKISCLENDLSNELYRCIQRTFNASNQKDLIDKLWLAVVDPKQNLGYHIVGGEKTDKAFDVFVKNNKTVYSSGELLINFYTTSIGFEKMFSKTAIEEKKPIEFFLNKAIYKQEENAFFAAEKTLFKSDSLTLYPIVSEGKYFLLAGFESLYKEHIESILSESRKDLSEIFQKKWSLLNGITESIQKMYKTSNMPTVIGKFIGGFTGGLLDSLK